MHIKICSTISIRQSTVTGRVSNLTTSWIGWAKVSAFTSSALLAVALPLLGREPLAHLGETAGEQGFPLTAIDAERGARACGALALYEPELVSALHLLQGLVRSPAALAGVMAAAGPGALAQAGRILARRWVVG